MTDGPTPEVRLILRRLRAEPGGAVGGPLSASPADRAVPAEGVAVTPPDGPARPGGKVSDLGALVLAAVFARPCLTIRQVIQTSGLPKMKVPHLLAQLVAAGRLLEATDGTAKVYVPALPGVEAHLDQVLILRNRNRARLFNQIPDAGCPRPVLIDQASQWGWPRVSTEHRLALLVRSGLVEATPAMLDGRRVTALRRLAPAPAVQQLVEVASGRQSAEALLAGLGRSLGWLQPRP